MKDVEPKLEQQSETAARWLAESPRVLIGAGAGLSVAAGIDYTDEEDFARRFPTLVTRGIRSRVQMIGRTGLPDAVFWGYWAAHVEQIRFSDGRADAYAELLKLVADKDWFVLTSNVDAMFARNGFDPERVCPIQGDYAFLQCLKPCTRQVWPSRAIIGRLVSAIDSASQALPPDTPVPRCIHCGGHVFMNVRAGTWFVDDPYLTRFERLKAWLDGGRPHESLLVLDIGSGFNTPSVVRWPMERVAAAVPTARLVRINPVHPQIANPNPNRTLSVQAGALETIRAIRAATESRLPGRLAVT